jgi:hypothetical protein
VSLAVDRGHDGGLDDGWGGPPVSGEWLVAQARARQAGDCEWLLALARFDSEGGWALDGALSCVSWLRWKAGMSKSTGYEKLTVAYALRRRAPLREAYRSGGISYSLVRLIARIERTTDELDEALVRVAETGTMADVEHLVRHYELLADQERPPRDPKAARALRVRRNGDGTKTLMVTLTDAEADEAAAALQALTDRDQRAEGEEDSCPGADAFMALARTVAQDPDAPQRPGDDRYLVHLVCHSDGSAPTFIDGAPVAPGDFGRMSCDASTVWHRHGRGGEPLDLGRRQRLWSVGQRRAINVRDRGTCRFPGCDNRFTDVHHIVPWHAGGSTDVRNGMLLCPRHHTLIHGGFGATGDANQQVCFTRVDGSVLGWC